MKRSFLIGLGLFAAGCFQPWPLTGPYLCSPVAPDSGLEGSCPNPLVCDDGVCCTPGGSPACPTLVPDGGTCPNKQEAKLFFYDGDGDGFGDKTRSRLACSRPITQPWLDNDDDCNDNEKAARPGAAEICDGVDNNCNGETDEGLSPLLEFFRDLDGDGQGDLKSSVMACRKPPGYSESKTDCDDTRAGVFLGAPEYCNGLDDNCNNATDDGTVETGKPCETGDPGLCKPGTYSCPAGAKNPVCLSTYVKSLDVCDQVDNDCDGDVDETPDCGGPTQLLNNAGYLYRAQVFKPAQSVDTTSRCLKDWPGNTGETWLSPKWTGAGSDYHVLFMEAGTGKTWDLTKPGLHLEVPISWSMVSPATPAWAASKQPVVYLCAADGGFIRYVAATSAIPNDSAGGSAFLKVPIAGGGGWIIGGGSGADLTRIKRLEFMVVPNFQANPVPSFTITLNADSGFR